MNTSSIHALAIAAEASAKLRHGSIAGTGLQAAAVLTEDKASPNADAATKAVSPLHALPDATATTALQEDDCGVVESKKNVSVGQSPLKRKPTFVKKLHAVLANKNLHHIIAWLPSGRSFCILDKDRFTTQVLPAYFRQAKFESFSRRIKRWGFKKMYTTGSKQFVFTHKYFRKDELDLCYKMNARGEQEETSDAIADAAKFENILTEQVVLPEKISASDKGQGQMPMKKRFVTPHSMFGAVTGHLPAAMKYEPASVSMLLPQAQLNQIQLKQQQMSMKHFESQCSRMNKNSIFSSSPPIMNSQVSGNRDTQRQLNKLNEGIARCEEQLVILEKLKALKNNFESQCSRMNKNSILSTSPPIMNSQGSGNRDTQRQLNDLNEGIARCEEQMIILERLKAFKQRRAMGY